MTTPRLVRPWGWGPNPYAIRYERHDPARADATLYRGVWERREYGKPLRYRACISVGSKTIHLGTFVNAVDAARAYDDAARLHHGPAAQLNFPGAGERAGKPRTPRKAVFHDR